MVGVNKNSERAGASLFVVIFTTLVLTIISVSFSQFMLRDQAQTQANDLSQRAYNSALAGVEDAKRVLIAMKKACTTAPTAATCTDLTEAVRSQTCDTLDKAGVSGTKRGNVYQETVVGDSDDNQAYTCTKIELETDANQGTLTPANGKIVYLHGTKNFKKIRLIWFTKKYMNGQLSDSSTVTLPSIPSADNFTGYLPAATEWDASTPPILRVQYIPPRAAVSSLSTSAWTEFLYPDSAGQTEATIDASRRTTDSTSSLFAKCDTNSDNIYGVCSIDLTLPVAATNNAYLQLSTLYNSTDFAVQMLDGSDNVVKFDGVQPVVDSTGRASNVFRRVKARVTVQNGASLVYPTAALYTQDDICKTFFITNDVNDYGAGACNPAAQGGD